MSKARIVIEIDPKVKAKFRETLKTKGQTIRYVLNKFIKEFK